MPLLSINYVILHYYYFSCGEKRANTQQFIALSGVTRTISTTCFFKTPMFFSEV